MSRKLISDLFSLLRVMSVTCFILISNFCEKRRRNICIVFCSLTFCFEISSEIVLDSKMLLFFPNVFYPIFYLGF